MPGLGYLAPFENYKFTNFTKIMKKIFLITAAVAFLAINAHAQDSRSNARTKIQVGLKAGANYSNIYDTKGESFDAEARFGAAGGVFLGIPIGRFLGIQPEVMYSQKGYKQTGSVLGSNYDLTRTMHFIDVPF